MTHEYTFTFTDSHGKIVVSTLNITDELLLGIGFGVYVFNKERGLEEDAESIQINKNLILVEEMKHDALMPDGWSPTDNPEDEPQKYILKYGDVYATFGSADFIQGAHTAFTWLNAPDLYKFTSEIYDTQTEQQIIVN